MKRILWLLMICAGCAFLTIPAEEELSGEEPVEEEAPPKAPAPKTAPKKAAPKKADAKKAAKKTPKKAETKKAPAKKAPAKKAPAKPATQAAAKNDNSVSWRFIGPFRTGYQDNLRKSAIVCQKLPDVQNAVKKQKFNWDKNIKGVTFSRKGNYAVLIVTSDEATLRKLQHALSKAFSNEVRTLTFVDKEDLTPAHFAAAKPPAPPKPKTAPKEAESEAEN